jgi:integrase
VLVDHLVPDPLKIMANHRFRYRNKSWRLYKRAAGADATWSIMLSKHGRRKQRSTGAANIPAAETNAKKLIDAVLDQRWAALDDSKLRRVNVYPPLAEVFEVYINAPIDNSAKTREYNVSEARRVLQYVFGESFDVDQARLDIFNADLVRKFFNKALGEVKDMDQDVAQRRKRSMKSWFTHACGLLTPVACEHYRQAGMQVPSLLEFRDVVKARSFNRVAKVDYHPPAQAIVDATIEGWQTHPDRNLFLAVGLGLAAGLRAYEVSQAKWGWITEHAGRPAIEGKCRVKSTSGTVIVDLIGEYWDIIAARIDADKLKGGDDDFIIDGSPTERTEKVFRRVSAWMRGLGWNTQKTFHEFRALAGCRIAVEEGFTAAAIFTRHSDVSTMQRYYGRYVGMLLRRKRDQA